MRRVDEILPDHRYKLFLQTAMQKKPQQFIGILNRKARNRILPRLPVDFDERYRRQIPDSINPDFDPHQRDNEMLRESLSEEEMRRFSQLSAVFTDGQITFLSRTRSISDPASVSPDSETIATLPRLWYLKLVGLEPVRWGVLAEKRVPDRERFTELVDIWIQRYSNQEHIARRQGYLRKFWTPYAVSLRVVTLCRYGALRGGFSKDIQRFLYKQLLFLENNVEWDVGGNHLFENGAALVVGGAAFPEHGERFVTSGLDVLKTTGKVQFLNDGYHYERSPMYHSAVTMSLLISLSVLQNSKYGVPDWLQSMTVDACSYLQYLRPPDGRIPLLNDAVFDETEHLDTILRYAQRLNIDIDQLSQPNESDVYWLSSNDLSMLADFGDSGPAEQLGHTHNDLCSLLVWHNSDRIVTDTGTFDYQPGERRQWARSIRAHNTVQVSEQEPSKFGGRFKMADMIETSTTQKYSNEVTAVAASYSAGGRNTYFHERTCYAAPDWFLVWDEVTSDRNSTVSRLHAHPTVSVEMDPKPSLVLESGTKLSIQSFNIDETKVESAPYFPRFGQENERDVLTLLTEAPSFGYLITDRDNGLDIDVHRPKEELRIDGESYPLPNLEL